jgi:hypothetical protein
MTADPTTFGKLQLVQTRGLKTEGLSQMLTAEPVLAPVQGQLLPPTALEAEKSSPAKASLEGSPPTLVMPDVP